jgi:hypothetical protein
VFQNKAKDTSTGGSGLVERARGVVVMAVPAGQRAGAIATEQARHGLDVARQWSAPKIEGLANVVETTVTPAVASTLRRGASAVQPEQESRMRAMTRSMMSWRGLVALLAAVAAGIAGAGFAMRKRYSSATAEAEKASTDAGSVPAQALGDEPASENKSRIHSGN